MKIFSKEKIKEKILIIFLDRKKIYCFNSEVRKHLIEYELQTTGFEPVHATFASLPHFL